MDINQEQMFYAVDSYDESANVSLRDAVFEAIENDPEDAVAGRELTIRRWGCKDYKSLKVQFTDDEGNFEVVDDGSQLSDDDPRLNLALTKDGNQYVVLFGVDLQQGIAGFGDTVLAAVQSFAREVVLTAPAQYSWIKCSERMPADELEVLITCDGDRHVAFYVSEKSISVEDRDFDGDTVYDDETDQSYWPAGWYVWNEGMEAWWNVHLAVTHWQPLPTLPAKDSEVQ